MTRTRREWNAITNPIHNPRRIYSPHPVTGRRTYMGMMPREDVVFVPNVGARGTHPMLAQVRFERVCRYSAADRVERKDRRGFLYVIAHPDLIGWVKVGRAKDPEQRLRDANTWCPGRNFKMLGMIWFEDANVAETEAHSRLRCVFPKGIGEWFYAADEVYKGSQSGILRMLNSLKKEEELHV